MVKVDYEGRIRQTDEFLRTKQAEIDALSNELSELRTKREMAIVSSKVKTTDYKPAKTHSSSRTGDGVSRRQFLNLSIAAGILLSSVAIVRGFAELDEKPSVERALSEIDKGKKLPPSGIYKGKIFIRKGAMDIRCIPVFDPAKRDYSDVKWDDIESIGDLALTGVESFSVENPYYSTGIDPDKPNDPKSTSPWMKSKGKWKVYSTFRTHFVEKEGDLFINIGAKNETMLEAGGEFVEIGRNSKGEYVRKADLKPVNEVFENIGKVEVVEQ